MKNSLKKVLSLMLVLGLVFSFVPVFADAKTPFEDKKSGLFYVIKAEPANGNNGEVMVVGDTSYEQLTEVEIPATVKKDGNTYNVTEIGDNAFNRYTTIGKVTFLEKSKLKIIGIGAFFNCTSLKEITIPSSVTSIGKGSFACQLDTNPNYQFNSKLEKVIFQENSQLTTIGESAFENCIKLTEITIPEKVKVIDNATFAGCIGFTSITIPKNVESIGYGAFYCDTYNEEFTSHLGTIIFKRATAPTFVEQEMGKGDGSFDGIKEGAIAIVPAGSKGENPEQYNENLYPFSAGGPLILQEIVPFKDEESGLFYVITTQSANGNNGEVMVVRHTSYLPFTTVEIPATIEKDGETYDVTEIGEGAFLACITLGKVTFADTSLLKKIETGAFSGCEQLQFITIPAMVSEIGEGAFLDCKGLGTVTFKGAKTPTFVEPNISANIIGSFDGIKQPAKAFVSGGQYNEKAYPFKDGKPLKLEATTQTDKPTNQPSTSSQNDNTSVTNPQQETANAITITVEEIKTTQSPKKALLISKNPKTADETPIYSAIVIIVVLLAISAMIILKTREEK